MFFTFYYAHVYAGITDHSLLVPLGLSMLGPASHSFGLSCASTVNGRCRCTDDLLQLAAVVYLSCDAVVAIRYTIIIGRYSGQCIFCSVNYGLCFYLLLCSCLCWHN